METEKLKQRKEKIFGFIKNNQALLQYLILLIIIIIGTTIRIQPLDKLIDSTTGKDISLELDSTLYLRYAQYIAQHGTLFEYDHMRFHPLGTSVDIGVFSSYFVAYLYKILNPFFGVSLEYVNNISPIISMVILTIFLFLLVRRLFDWRVAALSALLLNVSPSFLFRSLGGSSDHDMVGMMLVIMTIYFFVASWQSAKTKSMIIFSVIAGITTVLARLTGGSITFLLISIGIFYVIEILLDKTKKEDLFILMPWLLTFTLLLVALGVSSISGLIASIGTGIVYLAALMLISSLLFTKYHEKLKNIKYLNILPNGLRSLILSVILFVVVGTLFFGFGFIASKIQELYINLFKTFSLTRWVLTVAENKRPYVTDWFQQFGKYYTYLFIIGSIVLFYDSLKKFKRVKELTLTYAIFIFSYIFSRYSSSSKLNGETTEANILFFGSMILITLVIGIGYLYLYFKKHSDFEAIETIDKKHAFMIAWFLVMILAATSAIRLFFEFTPITTILFSFLMFYIIDYFSTLKEKIVKYAVIAVILLFIFSPFSFAEGIAISNYGSSYSTAKAVGPGYNQQWQRTGAWVRENTLQDSVFIHWWDYGYWVQSGFQRTTVTDGGNFFGWWNYLTGRDVLTNPEPETVLPFLKAHNVTHLLMVSDEIGKYGAYSTIGSDVNYDRLSSLGIFGLAPQQIEKTRNSTILVYTGQYVFEEDIKLEGITLPKGASGVVSIRVPVIEQETEAGTQVKGIGQPLAVVAYNGKGLALPMKCLYADKLYEFKDYALESCFRIIPEFQNSNTANPFGVGLYLSRRVYTGLFGQLYILNKEIPYFTKVYDDSAQGMPLAIVNGNIIGPQKIWQVNYPKDYKITLEQMEYNLRTTYPDVRLTLP